MLAMSCPVAIKTADLFNPAFSPIGDRSYFSHIAINILQKVHFTNTKYFKKRIRCLVSYIWSSMIWSLPQFTTFPTSLPRWNQTVLLFYECILHIYFYDFFPLCHFIISITCSYSNPPHSFNPITSAITSSVQASLVWELSLVLSALAALTIWLEVYRVITMNQTLCSVLV